MLAYLEQALGLARMSRLRAARVGIGGLGGLGSNTAVHLVRSGVRHLVLADFDRVENSNLNRQYYFRDQVGQMKAFALAENLRRINPDVDLTLICERITPANVLTVFDSCGYWVEAFDEAESKKMFVTAGLKHHKRVVAASGLAGWGHTDAMTTTQWSSGLAVVGDRQSAVGAALPPLAPRVGIGAAKEADVILSWILDHPVSGPRAGESPGARPRLPAGIYALTSAAHSLGRSNPEVAAEILRAGVKVLQYREKSKAFKEMHEECLVLRRLTRESGALLIVNDYPELALAAEADGVHIGQDDLPLPVVRKLVGPRLLLGVSTHSPEQARAAVAAGADYIGVGPIFATRTKENVCAPVGLEYLKYVVGSLRIPFVAIGGIKEHNLRDVMACGASTVALVTEIVGSPKIGEKVEKLQRIMADFASTSVKGEE
ncbi:thiamine-phosphate synthase [Peptococcaceae bacterium CEB3]|nr:thiamine-phosphate synthase [Peptococcaceae bacterium CEB3]